jgi:hypothetical protein
MSWKRYVEPKLIEPNLDSKSNTVHRVCVYCKRYKAPNLAWHQNLKNPRHCRSLEIKTCAYCQYSAEEYIYLQNHPVYDYQCPQTTTCIHCKATHLKQDSQHFKVCKNRKECDGCQQSFYDDKQFQNHQRQCNKLICCQYCFQYLTIEKGMIHMGHQLSVDTINRGTNQLKLIFTVEFSVFIPNELLRMMAEYGVLFEPLSNICLRLVHCIGCGQYFNGRYMDSETMTAVEDKDRDVLMFDLISTDDGIHDCKQIQTCNVCDERMDRESYRLHTMETTECKSCHQSFTLCDFEENHLGQCPKEHIDCPNECGMTNTTREYMTVHLHNFCPKSRVQTKCECQVTILRQELKTHDCNQYQLQKIKIEFQSEIAKLKQELNDLKVKCRCRYKEVKRDFIRARGSPPQSPASVSPSEDEKAISEDEKAISDDDNNSAV